MGNRIEGNLYVEGTLSAETMVVSASSVDDASVEAGAAIASTKLQHRHNIVYGQPNTTATAVTQVIYAAQAAGSVQSVAAGSIAIGVGAGEATVDIKKNGSTVLTGTIRLDSANTAYVLEAGTISSAAYVAGDVFTIVTTATAGGGTIPTGLFALVVFDEAAT